MLARRSHNAGMKKATYVRQLIRDEPFVTAEDVVEDATRRMGNARLRISRKRGDVSWTQPSRLTWVGIPGKGYIARMLKK